MQCEDRLARKIAECNELKGFVTPIVERGRGLSVEIEEGIRHIVVPNCDGTATLQEQRYRAPSFGLGPKELDGWRDTPGLSATALVDTVIALLRDKYSGRDEIERLRAECYALSARLGRMHIAANSRAAEITALEDELREARS